MMRKRLTRLGLLIVCGAMTGCGRAPSIDIIGSFFPVWMLCLTLAVVLASVTRIFLRKFQLEAEVGLLALFYPGLVTLFTSILWLVFFR